MNDYMNENREVLPGQETSYPENVVTFTKEELVAFKDLLNKIEL